MDFDDVLHAAGEWGRFQKQFYLMVALPIVFKGYQVMLVVFTVFVPKHRCAVPGLLNDTYSLVDEAHRQLVMSAIPSKQTNDHVEFDSCHVFADFAEFAANLNASSVLGNGSSYGNQSRAQESCSRWVYDVSEMEASLISKFDLVCDRRTYRAHSNMMMMFGFFVGSFIASFCCDWLGRKRIFCGCLVAMLAFGIASAFPTSPEVLLAFRFLSGTGLMGVMVSGFVLAVEVIGKSRRTAMGAMWQVVWVAGTLTLGCLSYVARDWRVLQLIGSVPTVVFLSYWWLVPESPRWLISKNRVEQAMPTLEKLASVNKTSLPPSVASRLQEHNAKHHTEQSASPAVVFRNSTLLLRFVIICFNWCVISMTYYGLSLNVSNLSGGIRVNFLASSIVELVGYFVAVLLLDRFGRKKLHTASMLLAAFACLFTIFTVLYAGEENQWTTTALAMVGKMGISSCFAIIYLYSAELYPTVLRNFGIGCGSALARVGSMLSPYIADLAIYVEGDFSTAVPLLIFGGLALGAGLASLLLPETLNRKLPETVLDAINFGKTPVSEEDTEDDEKTQLESSDDADTGYALQGRTIQGQLFTAVPLKEKTTHEDRMVLANETDGATT